MALTLHLLARNGDEHACKYQLISRHRKWPLLRDEIAMLLIEVSIVLVESCASQMLPMSLHAFSAFSVQEQQEPPIGPLPSRTRDGWKGIRGQTWHGNNDAAGKHAHVLRGCFDHLGWWLCACMHDRNSS